MSLPCCPECGALNLPLVDAVPEIRPGVLTTFDPRRHRSYRCACGWSGLTTETVTRHRPQRIRIRYRILQAAASSKAQGGAK